MFIRALKDNNMKITEKIFDITTGEETFSEREETKAEEQKRLAKEAEIAAWLAEQEKRSIDRAALLVKLNMTAEEAQLLIG